MVIELIDGRGLQDVGHAAVATGRGELRLHSLKTVVSAFQCCLAPAPSPSRRFRLVDKGKERLFQQVLQRFCGK